MSQIPSDLFAPHRLQALECALFAEKNIRVSVLRLDEMHPHLGGNKWFKLRPNIELLQRESLPLAVTFGGAYSNHLRALAAAGKELGFATLAFVRGERVEPLNSVLAFAEQCGMELRFLSRAEYRRRHEPDYVRALCAKLGPHLFIPEGGSNQAGFAGCRKLAELLEWPAEASEKRWAALACGTGTTMAGLISGLAEQQIAGDELPSVEVLGISVLKAPGYIEEQVAQWLSTDNTPAGTRRVPWRVFDNYHCGGYARSNASLQRFLADFATRHSALPLEPVYTGKLLFAVFALARAELIAPNSCGFIVHSGGIF